MAVDCPRLRDCPLSSPLLLDAARAYLARRCCPPGHADCPLRRTQAAAAPAAQRDQAVVGVGARRRSRGS